MYMHSLTALMPHGWFILTSLVSGWLQPPSFGHAGPPSSLKPPSVVYRVDSRKPEYIRAQGGFAPRELDLEDADFSIYSHSHGNSLNGLTKSPYVSTSIYTQGAEVFAVPGKKTYLYEIHATENFFGQGRKSRGKQERCSREAILNAFL